MAKGITGLGCEDRVRAEGATQLADLGLQSVCRVRRLPVAPQHVDQALGTDRLAAVQRQQGPLLGAPDRQRDVALHRLKLARQPDLHHPTDRPITARGPLRQRPSTKSIKHREGRRHRSAR
jgi:hypothetical protein